MKIIDEEIKKTLGAFVVLEYSQEKTAEHVKKLKEILLMDVAAEAYAEKGQVGDDMDFSKEAVEDFLLDNYGEEELQEVVERVAGDVALEYFCKLLMKESDEKKFAVNEILKKKF